MSVATEDPADRSEESSSPFAQLVAVCLDRMEREGPEALEAVCAEQPEDTALELRRIFASFDAWKREGGAEVAPPEVPDELGGFRLLRRLGGGGMGVVYLARQEPLGREVALKLIRPEALYFPGARQRFQREIEILVDLHHPGVVPILSVGEDRGLPYFAMELVSGATLAELLRALAAARPERLSGADLRSALDRHLGGTTAPSHGARARDLFEGRWTECCARIVREAAETLEFVHRKGVLHRDVKPSNLMVAPHGEVLLLDFGLSSRQDAGELTRTGSQFGSLPYMPPELFGGGSRSLDARGDIYSLGVTLYEMLAFDSPFAADTVEETRQRILDARPVPLRTHNPAVPVDLETICLAAMDPDPARRYPTAEAFAADLDRWLVHLPIQARRPGTALRVQRWIQRHPTASVALAMGALLCGIGPAVAMIARAEERAVANESGSPGLTLEAVELLVHTSETQLEGVPHVERVRRDLLANALACLRSMDPEQRKTTRVRRATGLAQGKLGDAERHLGRLDFAREHLEASLELQEELARSAPEDETLRLDLSIGCTHLAQLLLDLGEEERASALLERAASMQRELAAAQAADPFRRAKLAATLQQLATLAHSRGTSSRATALYAEVLELREQLAREAPEDLGAAIDLAETRNLRGVMAGQAREHTAALAELARARSVLEQLPDETRGMPRARWMLGSIASNEGLVLAGMRDEVAAQEQFENAEQRFAQLVSEQPLVSIYRENLAQVYGHQAILARGANRLELAEERQRKSLAELERLASDCEERVDVQSALGGSLHGLGLLHRRREELAEARDCFDRAIELQESAFRAAPARSQYRHFLRNHLRSASEVALELGEHAAAARAAERLTEVMSQSPEDYLRAAVVLASCALASADAADEGAAPYRKRAIALLEEADACGLADLAAVESESAFDAIRSDPAYERCVRAIEERALRKKRQR